MGEFRRAAGTPLPRTPVVARGFSPAEQLPSKHDRFITHSPAFDGRALGMCPGFWAHDTPTFYYFSAALHYPI
ncbi:hypothetical protein PYCCODRAFT_1435631, partial [Trametes coccinea BRFM310]